jgi:TRAP-type C4-dicarboxylate transport system permease small subunit
MNNEFQEMCLFSKLAYILNQIAIVGMSIALVVATGVMFAQVIFRYCFGMGFSWVEELVRYSGTFLAMFGLSPLTRGNSIVKVDLIFNRETAPTFVKVIIDAFVGFCLIVLIVKGADLVSFGMMSRTPGLRVPFGMVYTAIPMGGCLGIIQLIDRWIREYKAGCNNAS